MDASTIITKIHPSLDDPFGRSKNISDSVLEKLKCTVESLKEEKQQRLEKVMKLVLAKRHIYATSKNRKSSTARAKSDHYHNCMRVGKA